jgi:hypothetical protein
MIALVLLGYYMDLAGMSMRLVDFGRDPLPWEDVRVTKQRKAHDDLYLQCALFWRHGQVIAFIYRNISDCRLPAGRRFGAYL